MAQQKFKIETRRDYLTIRKYLDNNLIKMDISDELKKEIKVATANLLMIDKIEEKFEPMTKVLYLLPIDIQKKIKVTIRARRKPDYDEQRKQVTLDYEAHRKLSQYAKRYNITLSQAVMKMFLDIESK